MCLNKENAVEIFRVFSLKDGGRYAMNGKTAPLFWLWLLYARGVADFLWKVDEKILGRILSIGDCMLDICVRLYYDNTVF